MNISLRRVYAIFQKDVKDMMKNLYVSTALLMPLLLAAFYGKVYEELPLEAHFLVINLTFVMIGAYVQSALIAEEKEKTRYVDLCYHQRRSRKSLVEKV